MGDLSSRSLRPRYPTGAALLAAVFAIAAFDAAAAQESIGANTGPVVTLVADGGDIRAAGANVTITGAAKSIQAAGASVTVRASVAEDMRLAAAQVQFDGEVGGDVGFGGAYADVRGRIAGSVMGAGAVVVLNAVVGGDVKLGGAKLTLGPGTDIGGNLKAGGANVTVSGHVAGAVQVYGGLVTLNTRTEGSVEVRAAQLIVNAPTRISGDLVVYSLRDPIVAEGAVISGRITRIAPPRMWWSDAPWVWLAAVAIAIAAGTVLAGIVLMLFGGRVFATATGHVRHRPLSSFLFGVLALVLIPFIAVVLMATLIGISVGFAILLIVPFLVIFGHAVAAAGIAAGILIRRQGDLGVALGLIMLIIGAAILVGIGLIPYVGPALVAIALVLGTGAFTRTIGGRMRRAASPVMM